MRLLPEIADVIEFGGDPFHPVHCMAGLVNRLRRYTSSDGDPLAVSILAVGDAHTCTNPAYGRGQSLALLQAVMAADAVTSTATSPPPPASTKRSPPPGSSRGSTSR